MNHLSRWTLCPPTAIARLPDWLRLVRLVAHWARLGTLSLLIWSDCRKNSRRWDSWQHVFLCFFCTFTGTANDHHLPVTAADTSVEPGASRELNYDKGALYQQESKTITRSVVVISKSMASPVDDTKVMRYLASENVHAPAQALSSLLCPLTYSALITMATTRKVSRPALETVARIRFLTRMPFFFIIYVAVCSICHHTSSFLLAITEMFHLRPQIVKKDKVAW